MIEKYEYHQDAGHGWIKVPVQEVRALGIEKEVSGYSYLSRDKQYAYLEEDCDASLFFKEFKKKHGRDPVLGGVYYREYAPIRDLPCYACS